MREDQARTSDVRLDNGIKTIRLCQQNTAMRSPVSDGYEPITIDDVKAIAQKRLTPSAWNYYTAGADEEQTTLRNERVFKEWSNHPSPLGVALLIATADFSSAHESSATSQPSTPAR
jgi:uracil DNA glycosylase